MRQDSYERAVRNVPQAELKRLVDQLTPLAKCPDGINIAPECSAIVREWNERHPDYGYATPVVWHYLFDKYVEERREATRREEHTQTFRRTGRVINGGAEARVWEFPFADCNHLSATQYFAARQHGMTNRIDLDALDKILAKPNYAVAPARPSMSQHIRTALHAARSALAPVKNFR